MKSVVRLVGTFVMALLIGAVILLASGRNPLEFYGLLLQQSIIAPGALAGTLLAATPLMFTSVATAVAFKAGVFNVGVEGSMYLGAFAAAWVGFSWVGLPGLVLVPVAILFAGIVGALWAYLPGYAKAYLGVDEVVTTLLLNYVAISFTSYLVTYPFMSPGAANSMSPQIAPQAHLASIWPPSQLNVSFLLAVAVAVGVWFLMRHMTTGYAIRVVGTNSRFARVVGISPPAVMVGAMLISGFIGGLAGATQVLGVNYRFVGNFSPGYGFDGITIALMANNDPLGAILGAILLGALRSGGATVQLFSNIPLDLLNVLEAVIILLVTVDVAGWRPSRLFTAILSRRRRHYAGAVGVTR